MEREGERKKERRSVLLSIVEIHVHCILILYKMYMYNIVHVLSMLIRRLASARFIDSLVMCVLSFQLIFINLKVCLLLVDTNVNVSYQMLKIHKTFRKIFSNRCR